MSDSAHISFKGYEQAVNMVESEKNFSGDPIAKLHIHWVTWQPTPYHNYFFENLAKERSVSLLVHFLKQVLPSHPWKSMVPDGYRSRFCHMRWGLDWPIIWHALTDHNAFFVVSSWNQRTFLLLLSTLRLLRRKYAVWTDTPNFLAKRPTLFAWARSCYLRWIFSGAQAVMGTGSHAVSILGQMGAPRERLVDFPTFPDLAALKKSGDDPRDFQQPIRIISVGHITNRVKGHDLVARALAKVASMGLTTYFNYDIAGKGPDEDSLRQLIRTLRLEGNVRILGWLEPEEIKTLYRKADLLVHPSPVHDPYPNAVLDGMAAGLAVFVSDACGQAHDRISHGVNGFVHRAGDVEQLAEQLAELLTSPERIREIGRKARETAEQWPVERGVAIIRELAVPCAA